MLNLVPDEVWDDPRSNFLEPSCGNGNFIAAIIQKKLCHGSSIEQALNTTFGVDIQLDNVVECRQRIYDQFLMLGTDRDSLVRIVERNIRHGDFLKDKMTW